MAEQLRYKVTADTSQFVQGMKQVQASSAKANKAVRNQGQAFTQLAYALDDAQYGFRGVQNNLQAIAVTAGASGPVVLGLTAIIVALGYVISNFESANKELVAAKKNFEELTKVILSSDEQIIKDGATIQEQNKKTLSQLQKQLEAGRKLSYTTKTGKAVFIDLTEKEIKALQDQITELEGVIGKNSTLIKQAKDRIKYAKELQRIKDSEDIAEFAIDPPDAENPYDELKFDDSGNPLGGDRTPFASLYDDIKEASDALDELADSEAWDDLESALIQVGSKYAGLTTKQAQALKTLEEDLNNAVKSMIAGAITDLAYALGESLAGEKDFGQEFLKIIGSFMAQLGSLMIAVGVAMIAFNAGLASLNPAVLIGAGVALVAAGAAVTSFAKGGIKKNSSSSGGGGGTPSASVTPTGVQGVGSGGGIVGVVRGDDLRLLNERQSDTYRGRN